MHAGPLHVLIVENSSVYGKMVEKIMLGIGFLPHMCHSAAEAIILMESQQFQLICVDMHLPDSTGIELCRKVRQRPESRMVPVIMLTTEDKREVWEEAFDAGITEIFTKSGFEILEREFQAFFDGSLLTPMTGRVLVVEDSETSAQLILEHLRRLSIDADHYTRAEEALSAFRAGNYDAVITDILLEGTMSGLGLVRAIRRCPKDQARIPVLAISGIDDLARRIEVLRQGANDFITKPIVGEELAVRLANLITAKRLYDKAKAQQRALYDQAVKDALTTLYNRHYVMEFVPKFILGALRHESDLSVMVVDLDHFKTINDTLGHDAGDAVLKEIGKTLKSMTRGEDFAARIGGEEFLVVLIHCPPHQARLKAQTILEQVRRMRFDDLSSELSITASIGVTCLSHDGEDSFEKLFKRADTSVYAAKNKGRDQVVCGFPQDRDPEHLT
ncbi:diguanylate cyclase [Magnetococcus sp. PR-3]|uniref:diguanylate cyclase n=1 Tax=Magnetococcus sp. PR-3 TaxID=3120355 RepID=UPI002FCE1D0D